jgi:ribosomal protein S18 acetylase RimI-like enzyme
VAIEPRPWRGYDDLPAMQRLAVEQRRLLGPRAPWHIGDLAWGFRQHAGRESEWRIRLCEDGDRVVAWSWLRADGKLDVDVLSDNLGLLAELLADPDARSTYAFADDEDRLELLAHHGFDRPGEVLHFLARDLSEPPAALPPPDGFTARTVADDDLAERVAIHRDVWAPSRVTEESFADVRSTWPYRASLDCVLEPPEGGFAAYCLIWPDDENGVGELEPVGVRAEFRRRGLGAAVCTDALRRLHEQGGREAIVYCLTDEACALYTSIGFRRHAQLVEYSR